jgi:hypothetical protein
MFSQDIYPETKDKHTGTPATHVIFISIYIFLEKRKYIMHTKNSRIFSST